MFTTIGWSESQDTSGNLTNVAALADQHVRVSGDDIYVPELNILLGAIGIGATISRARITSPSLRALALPDFAPVAIGAELAAADFLYFRLRHQLELVTNEVLNAQVAETAAGAEQETVLAWLADALPDPVAGDIRTVRATNATTLVANAWTNGALTLDQTLPVGRYAIVGARAESAGLLAFRFVFVGGIWRPGGLGCDAAGDPDPQGQRMGGWGVWGEFDSLTPPSVDFLSVSADTSQVLYLDLIRLS